MELPPMPQGTKLAARVDAAALEFTESHSSTARSLGVAHDLLMGAVLVLFAIGVVAVGTSLREPVTPLVVIGAASLPSVRCRVRAIRAGLLVPLVVVVPVLTLVAVNVVYAPLGDQGLGSAGLLMAAAVMTAASYANLRWYGRRPAGAHRSLLLGVLAGALAVGYIAVQQDDLTVGIVLAGASAAIAIAVYLHREVSPGFGRPLGHSIVVVGAFVVALPIAVTAREVGSWWFVLACVLSVAGAFWIGRRFTPVSSRVSLSASVVQAVLFATLAGGAATLMPADRGDAGTPVATPGAALAVSPVAIEYRPVLLFDSDERQREPLDVTGLLAAVKIEQCPDGPLAACRDAHGAEDLHRGGGDLRFSLQDVEDAQIEPAYYVNDWTDQRRNERYLDYWWYLADNPTGSVAGALCGAGLAIAEVTCFDHQSDWEGVTVVLDTKATPTPVAVHYAQHNGVTRVPWTELVNPRAGSELAALRVRHKAGQRPLVFIARGTHAAYPTPCWDCKSSPLLLENRANGGYRWTEEPGALRPFPMTRPYTAADQPEDTIASWNDFDGAWGTAACWAAVHCSAADSPPSPGHQGRFKRPWCFARVRDLDRKRLPKVAARGDC